MNIQPIGINQNRQQNFGMQIKWEADPNLLLIDAKNVINNGQQTVKKLLEMVTPQQRAELGVTLNKLEDTPAVLEFRPLGDKPSNDIALDLFSMPEKFVGDVCIEPTRLNGPDPLCRFASPQEYAEFLGEKIINRLRKLIPQVAPPEISATELAQKLVGTA